MRSTQFDDQFHFHEEPEEHRRRKEPDTLCEDLKRLGFSQNDQVKLYGEVFDLLSDPFSVGENLVLSVAQNEVSKSATREWRLSTSAAEGWLTCIITPV
jgi:hypothetical protein